MEEMDDCRELIRENIDYADLLRENPWDAETIDGYVELMVEACCTTRDSVRICGQDVAAEVVKSRFLKLNGEHILYVMTSLKENTTKVASIKAYILSALYNVPVTMGQYYTSRVSHDMAKEINILVVEPGKPPRPARARNTLETFAEIVGGPVEAGCYLPARYAHQPGARERRRTAAQPHQQPGRRIHSGNLPAVRLHGQPLCVAHADAAGGVPEEIRETRRVHDGRRGNRLREHQGTGNGGVPPVGAHERRGIHRADRVGRSEGR